MIDSDIPSDPRPFRLAFAPFAELREGSDSKVARTYDTLAANPGDIPPDEFPGAVCFTLMSLFPGPVLDAIADAFECPPASMPPDHFDFVAGQIPSRVREDPDGVSVLVLPEELRPYFEDGDIDLLADECRDIDLLIPFADAAVRLYGAIPVADFLRLVRREFGFQDCEFGDSLESRLDLAADVARCRHGILFHSFLDETTREPDDEEPDDTPLPGFAAPVPDIARKLAALSKKLPRFVPSRDEFLAWADPAWCGDAPWCFRLGMALRNADPDATEDMVADAVGQVYLLVQLMSLGAPTYPSGELLDKLVASDQIVNRLDEVADECPLWTLNGYTADQFPDIPFPPPPPPSSKKSRKKHRRH
jgi:hypothetical protein